jgi:hypothetical protein
METQALYQTRPKMIKIEMPRCSLFLTEQEILGLLAKDRRLWTEAIGRGKALLRNETTRKRQTEGFNRWTVYEILKNVRPTSDADIQNIEAMDASEAKEGLIEYLLARKRGCVS